MRGDELWVVLAYLKDEKLFVLGNPVGQVVVVSSVFMKALARSLPWGLSLRVPEVPVLALPVCDVYGVSPHRCRYELVQPDAVHVGTRVIRCAFAPINRRWVVWRGDEG